MKIYTDSSSSVAGRVTKPVPYKAYLVFSAWLVMLGLGVFPDDLQAQTYGGPLVITKGGTYKGNWESRNSEVAAVEVRTSEAVVIVSSNIRGAGYLIKSWGYGANITVRHTNGYGLTPTPWRDYRKPRRFLTVNNFKNVVVENCYLESTAGIYLGTRYEGDGSANNTVKIRYNKAQNIDGRVYGGSEHSQFAQFNFRGNVPYAEIAWNQVINEPNLSLVEDNINIYNSRGTASSPIRIHNNFIRGAYPVPANATNFSGGGIITDGDGDLTTCTAHVDASNNQLINLGNHCMGIAGGNNIRYHHNRAVNSARFRDGSRFAMYTSGLWSKDYYAKNTTFANTVDYNVVGVTAWGYPNNRNDISVAENATFIYNSFLPGGAVVTSAEDNEYTTWTQKLKTSGIVLGPKGGVSAKARNQAPTVSLTAPLANATFAAGTAITLAANAYDPDGYITKVEFFRGTAKLGESTTTHRFVWTNAPIGTHQLTAKATDNKGATRSSAVVTISVTAASASSGSITAEFWASVTGGAVRDIPVATTPSSVEELRAFEAPLHRGGNSGLRVRGYVTAPVSGPYTFWLEGDRQAELWLSASEDPAGKKKIAMVLNDRAHPRNGPGHHSHQSGKMMLEAGRRYYIEALMKQEPGGSHLAVGWQLPDGTMERPIAGNRLSPVSQEVVGVTSATALLNAASDPIPGGVTVYPNPFRDAATLDFGKGQMLPHEVVLFDAAGRVVYQANKLDPKRDQLAIRLAGDRFHAGLYILKYVDAAGKSRWIKLVKE